MDEVMKTIKRLNELAQIIGGGQVSIISYSDNLNNYFINFQYLEIEYKLEILENKKISISPNAIPLAIAPIINAFSMVFAKKYYDINLAKKEG